MTDDYAIEGEEVGYVPCFELPAVLVVEEEGAISGLGTGRVARGRSAASLPAPEREAIVGSGVGYVPGPCVECVDGRQRYIVDTFGRVEPGVWGVATSPDYDLTSPAGTWVEDIVQADLGPITEEVDGDYGIMNLPGPPFDPEANASITDMILTVPNAWVTGIGWIECRWQHKANGVAPDSPAGGTYYLFDVPNQRSVYVATAHGLGAGVLIYGRIQSGINFFQISQTAQSVLNYDGDPFWMAIRLESGVLKFKAWLDGDTEPADWEINPVSGVALQIADITHTVHRPGGLSQDTLYPTTVSTGYIELTVPC